MSTERERLMAEGNQALAYMDDWLKAHGKRDRVMTLDSEIRALQTVIGLASIQMAERELGRYRANADQGFVERIESALVEAMARALNPSMWDILDRHPGEYKPARDEALRVAESALSALLATGSVVICSPELKALMEVVANGSVSQVRRARVNWLATPQGTAFVRTSQES